MNADILADEIIRIADLAKIEHEPELQTLWQRCRAEDYPQPMKTLRQLVSAQVNAERDGLRQQQTETQMNHLHQEHFLLNLGKSVRIGGFTPEHVNGHLRHRLDLMSRPDFLLWTKYAEAAEDWLKDPLTKKYVGIICDPSKPAVWDGKLNLWRGFGIQPAAGDAQPFVDYVTILLAQRVPEWAEFILNWLAWVLQNPGERIGVALCLISALQGTGKGSLGNLLLTIFGQHGVSVSRSDGLTGHFNAHLEGALFAFADEALFAGDLRGADAFKNIITEPWISITRKGVDSHNMENRLSILMATNHRFAAQVEWSDRRFAMFEVNEAKQTRSYWDDLHRWLTQGGKNIVLDFLLQRDLTGWHPVDDRPMTPVYMDQRRQSLRETHRWWHEVLEAENLAAGTGGFATPLNKRGEFDKKDFYGLYKAWHERNEHKASRAASQQTFWRDFWAMTQGEAKQSRPGKTSTDQVRVVVLPVVPTGESENGPPGMSPYHPDWGKLFDAFEKWLAQK